MNQAIQGDCVEVTKGAIRMRRFYKNIGKAWENKRGNECQLKLVINTHRWFIPLGIDYRSGLSWAITIGVLCFSLHYSEFKGGWTPLSKSIGRIV